MIRKATLKDVPDIHRFIEYYAEKQLVLHRSKDEIIDSIRDFSVADTGGRIVGCSALHVYGPDLAEIKSLAIDAAFAGRGWGSKFVLHALDDATALGIGRVFALTYEAPFFEKLGFRLTDKGQLPEKIWGDCQKCERSDDCDEVCVIIHIEGSLPSPRLPVLD